MANEEKLQASPTAKIRYLQAMEIFRDLTRKELEEYDSSILVQSCKAGHVFYMPGQTGEALFILKVGAVQLYRLSPQGRKLVLQNLEPLSLFGEMSCVGHSMNDTFAEATKDSLICTMSKADVERLLLTKPKVAVRLLDVLSRQLRETEQRLEDFAFRDLVARAAALLLKKAKSGVVIGFSQQEIADELGVYRESTTNALNHMRSAGWIDIGRKKITILDKQRLEKLTEIA